VKWLEAKRASRPRANGEECEGFVGWWFKRSGSVDIVHLFEIYLTSSRHLGISLDILPSLISPAADIT